jgi:hypothetical protein
MAQSDRTPLTDHRTTDDGRPLLKMKALVEKAGVPKATVLHYIHLGLLPEPAVRSRNMALYHPDCVETIHFIKNVQTRYRLPLASIRGLLKERERGRYTGALVELHDTLFGSRDPLSMDKNAYCEATGLPAQTVDACVAAGLIAPLQKGVFDHEDLVTGHNLAYMLELGASIEDLAFYGESARRLSEKEVALRKTITRHLPFEEDVLTTLELTRKVRVFRAYVMDRAFQRRVMASRGIKDDLGRRNEDSRR